MIEQIGGRKLAAAILVIAIGVGVTAWKGDVPENLKTLLEIIYGLLVGGNVINTVSAIRAESNLPAPQIDTTQLNQLTEQQGKIAEGVSLVQQLLQIIIKKAGLDKV
jgi:hypothetical protein